jgi:hypothetical protein
MRSIWEIPLTRSNKTKGILKRVPFVFSKEKGIRFPQPVDKFVISDGQKPSDSGIARITEA